MSNFQSVVGGASWAMVSLLLIFAALEPVSVENKAAASQQVAAADQAPQQSAAA